MQASEVFSIANTLVLPMWLLLIAAPKWKVTVFLTDYKVFPLLLAVIYAFYIIKSQVDGGSLDFSSLESVAKLFSKEEALLAGWVHYLAFDLLIGIWMVIQNRTLKIHTLLMAPCLLFTFMLGPIGFLLFSLIKYLKTSKS